MPDIRHLSSTFPVVATPTCLHTATTRLGSLLGGWPSSPYRISEHPQDHVSGGWLTPYFMQRAALPGAWAPA